MRRILVLAHLLMLSLCLFWLSVQMASAQSTNVEVLRAQVRDVEQKEDTDAEHLKEVDRRIDAITSLKLEERITRVETLIENDHNILIFIMGGLALLLVDALLRIPRFLKERVKPGIQ